MQSLLEVNWLHAYFWKRLHKTISRFCQEVIVREHFISDEIVLTEWLIIWRLRILSVLFQISHIFWVHFKIYMFCLNDSFKTNLNNFTKFKVGIIYDIVRNALVLKNPFKLQKKLSQVIAISLFSLRVKQKN